MALLLKQNKTFLAHNEIFFGHLHEKPGYCSQIRSLCLYLIKDLNIRLYITARLNLSNMDQTYTLNRIDNWKKSIGMIPIDQLYQYI